MKRASIQKPQIDTAKVLDFATGAVQAEPARGKVGRAAADAQKAAKASKEGRRVFFAPAGHRRLTINLPDEVHKKLRLLAVEKDSTVTELLVELVGKHL